MHRFIFIMTIVFLGSFSYFSGYAAQVGTIDPVYKYAWSEDLGWINLSPVAGSVEITSDSLRGFIWNENTGWINLHSSAVTYVHNDGEGVLSGFAWGEGAGYVDFSGVSIDRNGYFHGYASSTHTGRISFNCDNTSSCAASDFKVRTDWHAVTLGSSFNSYVPTLDKSVSHKVEIQAVSTLHNQKSEASNVLRSSTLPRETVDFVQKKSYGTVNIRRENIEDVALFDVNISQTSTVWSSSLLMWCLGAALGAAILYSLFQVFKKRILRKTLLVLGLSLFMTVSYFFPTSVNAQSVTLGSAGFDRRVSTDEPLLFSVRLFNFGSHKRTDVIVTYRLLDKDNHIVSSESETIAVETTASFIKQLHLPQNLPAGIYTAEAGTVYPGQVSPAISQFMFEIEPKILGFFRSDFFVWLLSIIISALSGMYLTDRAIDRWRKRFVIYDYSHVVANDRLYYETISDTIGNMRQHVGDEALRIASNIPGLVIDPFTGKVLFIERSPSKILEVLILRYEALLGRCARVARRG